jgi:hypothetical protein
MKQKDEDMEKVVDFSPIAGAERKAALAVLQPDDHVEGSKGSKLVSVVRSSR